MFTPVASIIFRHMWQCVGSMRRATSVLQQRSGSTFPQGRSVSTAAKLRPQPDSAQWSRSSTFTAPSKWARPESLQGRHQGEGAPPVVSKWSRSSSDTTSSVSPNAKLSKWGRSRTLPDSYVQKQPAEAQSSLPSSEGNSSHQPSSLPSTDSARFTRRSSRGHLSHLDRDPAPHQAGRAVPVPPGLETELQLEELRHISKGSATQLGQTTQEQMLEETQATLSSALDENAEDDTSYVRTLKPTRGVRKTRGSLLHNLEHEDAAIPNHGKYSANHQDAESVKQKKKKTNNLKNVSKKVAVDLFVPSVVSVDTLARLLNVRIGALQAKMVEAGMAAEATPDHILTSDYASLLVMEFGRNPIVNDEAAFDIHPSPPRPERERLPLRPPIVTIMGHVDHGKTTLLDTLRSSSVARGEEGGITQHIGAFSVPVGASQIVTFLDTPGHAAFAAMRARGAMVTDIIVLVVAADDGVMPQTREVIDLIKKEGHNIGVVVAVNKIDKPGVDVGKTIDRLAAEGLQLETLGGDIPVVQVSGLTGKGLDELVETISAVAELQDLRAEQDGQIHGYVLESKVHKGLGLVATVLVLRGTLKPGTHLISGRSHAKVRVLQSPSGASVKSITPGNAVVVSGWKELPAAGDDVLSGTEDDVKKALANRIRKAEIESSLVDLEAINEQRRQERELRELEESGVKADTSEEGHQLLKLIIKADVSGSAEALVGAISGIGNDKIGVKVVSSGVGEVTESDVMRAKTAEGMIVAFNVKIPRPIEVIAAQNNVPLYSTGVIYRLLDDITERLIAMLPVTVEVKVTGEANVLQIFDIKVKSKQIQKVAGCRVVEGVIEKGKKARIVRGGEVISEAPLETLRVFSKDVAEVRKGSECGLGLQGFEDVRQGDVIQIIQETEKPGAL